MIFPILSHRDERLYGSPQVYGNMARVSKRTAKRLYIAGYELIIVTNKYGPWLGSNTTAMRMSAALAEDAYDDSPRPDQFTRFVNAYQFANCGYETGYYPAFYVQMRGYANDYITQPGPAMAHTAS